MLKMLKADFYKIIKSKMLLIVFILALSVSLINPIRHAADTSQVSAYNNLCQQGLLYSVLWVFVIPFACKDLSSGYMKNLLPAYSEEDKICYILSKVFYIFVFCVLYMLLNLVFEIIFNFIFGVGVVYDNGTRPIKGMEGYFHTDGFTVGQFYLRYLCLTLNCVAIGTVILFLCMLIKKEYIVTIIVLPYLFLLSHLIYDAIDRAVGGGFHIELYTIFGLETAFDFQQSDEYLIGILLSLGYTAFFTVSSWLVFRKRSF